MEPLSGREEAIQRTIYTERQEYWRCGKAGCKCATGPGHGPYVYRYWTEGGKTRREYVGKQPPAAGADN